MRERDQDRARVAYSTSAEVAVTGRGPSVLFYMPGAALLALRGCCCCRPACLLACCHLVVVLLQFTHSHARTCMLLGSNNNNTHTHFSHTLIACFPFAVHALSLSRALALSLTLPARPGLPDPGPAPWGKILLTERRRTLSPAPAHVSA